MGAPGLGACPGEEYLREIKTINTAGPRYFTSLTR